MWDIGCVFRSGVGRQMRQAVRFKIKRCRCSGVGCFQICFLQLIRPISPRLMKCRGLGPDSFWSPSGGLVEQGRKLSAYTQGGTLWFQPGLRAEMLLPDLSHRDGFLFTVSRSQWQVKGGSRYLSRVPSALSVSQRLKRSRALFVKPAGTAGPIPVDGDECRLPRLEDIWGTRKLY